MSNEHVEAIRQHAERLRIGSRSSDRWLYADSINKHADDLRRQLAEAEATIARWERLHLAEESFLETGAWTDSAEEREFEAAYRALEEHGDLPATEAEADR